MDLEIKHLSTHMHDLSTKAVGFACDAIDEISRLRQENERLKGDIKDLQDDRQSSLKLIAEKNEVDKAIDELRDATRWRKCSEELPKDGETVLVLLGRTPKTRGFFLTSRYVAGEWTYGEDPQGCKPTHWFRIPKAPEVK